jgi:hypothetical protein
MLNLTIKKAKVSFSTKPTFKKMVKTMRAKIHKFARKGKLRFNQFYKPNTLIINMLILNLTAMLSRGEPRALAHFPYPSACSKSLIKYSASSKPAYIRIN